MDGEAWRAAVHGVTKSWTRLSNCTELHCTELRFQERQEVVMHPGPTAGTQGADL